MIDFDKLQAGVKTWATQASGLPPNRVVWADEAQHQDDKPWIKLRIAGIKSLGTDARERTDTGTEEELDAATGANFAIVGQRTVRIEVRAVSRSQKPKEHAPFILETVKSSLMERWAIALLKEHALAIVLARDVMPVSVKAKDNRVESVYQFELSLGTVSVKSDKRSRSGVIDSIDISSEISGADGALLRDSLQMQAEVIPEPETP